MRSVLARLAIGLAGAGVVFAAGWVLQAGALPSQTRADRDAARVAGWLQGHRRLRDGFRVDGQESGGACLRGWFRNSQGSLVRGSRLVLTGGPVWLVYRRGGVRLVRGRHGPVRLVLLEARVGCSGELVDVLLYALRSGAPLGMEKTRVAGEPAIELRLPGLGRAERLTLYASWPSGRLLQAVVVQGRREVSARLYPVGATPAER